jgi:nucleoside-diphosphate-sugar epimerase
VSITGALITGGGGFLGSHLAEHIATLGAPVVCIDNFCTGLRNNQSFLEAKFPRLVTFFETDVCNDPSRWREKIPADSDRKISHVFHFASPASPPHYQRIPLETLWANSLGLKNALQFADDHKARLVFASTSEVYGSPSISPQPESYWGYVNSY